jgi:RNA polymerase sigma-70 factor, ECF subfamily
MQSVDEFEDLRPTLLGLAYRLLGSMWDAEDVVQEAWLRWNRMDRHEVRQPRAFLLTVVSRLALDQLRSARVRREAYVGPWLPEPVATEGLGPLDTAQLRDTVSFATLMLMEKLSPAERAVYVLRHAFDVPYSSVAEILGTSEAACRQLFSRAGRRLQAGKSRYQPTRDEHERLLTSFLLAAKGGDLAALSSMLAADVTAWNDGGGKVRAALRPISGRDKVLTFIRGLLSTYSLNYFRIVDVNGQPAAWLALDGEPQFLAIGLSGGLVIRELYAVLNPEKLARLG